MVGAPAQTLPRSIDEWEGALPAPDVITFTDGVGRCVLLHKDGLVVRKGFETDQQAMAAVYQILRGQYASY